jgi:transcriptional regulator with XRE-family HTH domain
MVDAEIDVFAYSDYRAFLRDYYRARKATGRGFSYRSFSRRAGLKSPNYLKLIVDGARNLSPDMAERFAEACGLADDKQRYFVQLVALCQAASSADRSRYRARLVRVERFRRTPSSEALAPAQASAMSSLRVCLGEAGLRSLQERLQRFHKDLQELSALESDAEQVLQISFQLLPLSPSHQDDPR